MGQQLSVDIQLCLSNKPRGGQQQRPLDGFATGHRVCRGNLHQQIATTRRATDLEHVLTDAVNFRPLHQLQLAGLEDNRASSRQGACSGVGQQQLDWNSYVQGFNNYHKKMLEDEDNMMQQEE